MGWKKAVPTSSPAGSPAGGPPIQVVRSRDGNRTYSFSEKLQITSNTDNCSFSLVLAQDGVMGSVFTAQMEIDEKVNGKGSVKLTFGAVLDQVNGATCGMSSRFSGAVEVEKGRISSPPLPDTEFVTYDFADRNLPSYFIVEKKANAGFVDRITAAHCIPISEEAFYYVVVKIAVSKGEGLCVDVEGPVMRTLDFVANLWERFIGKVERKVNQRLLSGSSGDKEVKVIQRSGSYVNSGMQSQKGLINSSGFMTGFGNGALFHNCRFLHPNK